MSWSPLRTPVDTFVLAGQLSPGIAEIVGAGSPRKWEEIGGMGWSGGILVYQGIKLSRFRAVMALYTDEHWAEWTAFAPLVLRGPNGKRPRSMAIVHPQLAAVGIHACVVEDVLAPTQTADSVWSVEVHFIEAKLLRKGAPARPDGAEATQAQDDPKEREIERLTNVRNQLAGTP